jgi:DNA polymerase-1
MIEKTKKIEIAKWLLDPEGFRKLPNNLSSLEKEIKTAGLEKIYREIELPLVPILEQMHKTGIGVQLDYLKKLEKDLSTETVKLAKKIFEIAGGTFNLNSPQQLSNILFKHLKIDAGNLPKRKSGARSTDAASLAEISQKHKIIPLILKYRELHKINSTYVRPLIALADKEERIHTTFIQTRTATGRLSSEKPNLQNLPALGEWAKKLRRAFWAKRGASFVSFDYSQIELRVLAAVSGDIKMMKAFREGVDIHRLTASQIFNRPLDLITPEQRSLAKTLNFGIIYGMGPASFAKTAGLSLIEAQRFIEKYFFDFAQVRRWRDEIIQKAHALGYVENLNGRKRYLPHINSPDKKLSAAAERAAINMPIQGLAADIIKLAMIKSVAFLKPLERKAKLILSIHDELVFEIDDDILKEVIPKLKRIIENCYSLRVPLVSEAKVGKNLGEMEKYQ